MPSKEGAELISQLGDGVETCRLQGSLHLGSPQAPTERVQLPWERAPSEWAPESRSAACDSPNCLSDSALAQAGRGA